MWCGLYLAVPYSNRFRDEAGNTRKIEFFQATYSRLRITKKFWFWKFPVVNGNREWHVKNKALGKQRRCKCKAKNLNI
jgi:hypothetical protein